MTVHHFLSLTTVLLLLSPFAKCQQQDTLTLSADTSRTTTDRTGTITDTSRTTTDRTRTTTDKAPDTTDTALSITDTTIQEHSPRKASIYSAVCPGLGQIYNHKYWKVPIVYVGFGVCVGSTIYNARNYKNYKDKYIYMLENDLKEYSGQTLPEVQWYKNTHRRYRDLFILVTAGFYALQIIDASVDAYLFYFDVSDDLSLFIDPVLTPQQSGTYSLGLRCCLYF